MRDKIQRYQEKPVKAGRDELPKSIRLSEPTKRNFKDP